ncbi:MAG: IS110 family transposase [Pseudonocardiaceae bacterium]
MCAPEGIRTSNILIRSRDAHTCRPGFAGTGLRNPRWEHRQGAPGRPHYYLLEAEGSPAGCGAARHVKNVPGRPKTDKLDAVWLAKVAERAMCSPSLVHPKPIPQLRDLVRYRQSLIRERTREKQRVEKLLEDAQVKLSSVISDIFGMSGGRCSRRWSPVNTARRCWRRWRGAACGPRPWCWRKH